MHATASEVEFFSADATLEADFGDGEETGTITGEIDNIYSGGRPVDDSIYLTVSDPGATALMPNISTDGFSGRARMENTGDLDTSGEAVYRFTGTWSGNFYNAVVDDTDTADVDESEMAPGSVAGTFGVGRGNDPDTMMVDETESYVGAFGAHLAEPDPMNGN